MAQKYRKSVERKSFADSNGKVLPADGEPNVLVTSALPYVNNAPHLGNIIGSTLSADVFARYSRTRNVRTLYVCGTDEYGTTTETKALSDGVTPRELCDKYHKIHADSYAWFEIGFDHFGRTSTPQQTEICQDIFLKLYNNGHLEEKSTPQLYCETNKKFLADRFVEGTCPTCGYDDARGDQCDKCTNQHDPVELLNPRCKLCDKPPVPSTSTHLFIKFAELQEQIQDYVTKASSKGVWASNAVSQTKGWLTQGLEARAMTRDLQWGVPVPLKGWEHKVMYVWFDAPIGYPSITANYTEEWRKWWRDERNIRLVQFMGKDNIAFHTMFFPAYLIGTNEEWVKMDSISTTEYLNYEGTKFSKSRNVGVFGENARDTGISSAVWRYCLLANRPEAGDTQFTWKDFINRNNGELLNNLGNFVNRAIKFMNAKYDSIVPGPSSEADLDKVLSGPLEAELTEDINALLTSYTSEMENLKLRPGLEVIMRISARGNGYLQKADLSNDMFNNQRERCDTVMLVASNLIYLLSVLLHPFMPSTGDNILKQLNAPSRSLPTSFSIDLFPGHVLGKADHLFKRIDPKMEDVWRLQFGGLGAGSTAPDPKVDGKKAKKLAAKAKQTAPAFAGPKPPEYLELEKKIEQQGAKVRAVKANTAEGNVVVELASLQELKSEMTIMIERLSSASLENKS